MKVWFDLQVKTQPGERVFVIIKKAAQHQELVIELFWQDGRWKGSGDLRNGAGLIYYYEVRSESESWSEFGEARTVKMSDTESLYLRDHFRYSDSPENLLHSSPFYKAFFNRKSSKKKTSKKSGKASKNLTVSITLRAPRVGPNYLVGIMGNTPELGEWSEGKVRHLNDPNYPIWDYTLDLPKQPSRIEYKYVIVNAETGRIATWETGGNRVVELSDEMLDSEQVAINDEYFSYPSDPWKGAGFAIPVFSIRSESGAGVGEFADIPKLVDWAVKTNMKIIQVLPVNDTVATHTWKDSYPYASISVHALHPIYASMKKIGDLKDKKLQKSINEEAERLNQRAQLDYEGVMKLKSKFFKYHFDEVKIKFLNSKELNGFITQNISWIIAYAVFSFLRDKFKTADFSQWGEYAQMTDEQLIEFAQPGQDHYEDIAIHYYIQYHLDQQLKEATEYARQHGVVLKGDIPIGIFRHSVDAWRWPHLFNMDTQTGAPPDDFSVVGQNWGFPTYNWEAMEAGGYRWWISRMKKMADYFDVFRIDHILGFFRIWEMPKHAIQGIMGHFSPALPYSISEIESRGISWNYDRFCKPYISEDLLDYLFAEHTDWIKKNFLIERENNQFDLKPEFSTQVGICNRLDKLVETEPGKAPFFNSLRLPLYSLPGEVLFFESDKQKGSFNPRISLHQTSSFAHLDPMTRHQLFELHNDYFYHRHNHFWRESALRKLPMLKRATNMLICGEDLGMVPACVPGVMDELQILSLAIQRMPNDAREFWQPADIPWMYVTSTGSHDVSNLREWWLEDSELSQRFFNNILHFHGIAPKRCEAWVAYETVRQHLASPAMLAVFPIQDILAMSDDLKRGNAMEERINVPAIVPHYWRYRLHINIEELLEADKFNGNLSGLVESNGRFTDY